MVQCLFSTSVSKTPQFRTFGGILHPTPRSRPDHRLAPLPAESTHRFTNTAKESRSVANAVPTAHSVDVRALSRNPLLNGFSSAPLRPPLLVHPSFPVLWYEDNALARERWWERSFPRPPIKCHH